MGRGKRFLDWQIILSISLIALSAVIYFLHYAIFKDAHHIFIYLLGDIAFVPIEVLLVTLIIIEWLAYMKHLRENYPYLFSLAIRTNPFDPNAEVEVR